MISGECICLVTNASVISHSPIPLPPSLPPAPPPQAHVAVANPKIEKEEYFEKVLRNLEAYVRPPAGKSKMGTFSPLSLPPPPP